MRATRAGSGACATASSTGAQLYGLGVSSVLVQQPAAQRRSARAVRATARAGGFLGGSAPLLVVAVAVSVQSGAALATRLFATIGPLGTVWLRSAFAAGVLLRLAGRPLRALSRRVGGRVLALGVVLAAM